MRRPFAYSLILHLLIIVAAILGLPSLRQPPVKEDEPVIVDLVAVPEGANPPPAAQLAPKLETAKPAESIAPKPEPRPEPPQARAEEPPARTEQPMLAAAPEPSPPPPPEAVPKPEPKTELRPTKPEREQERPQPKPEPTPEKAEGKLELPKPERKTVARAEPEAAMKVEPRPQAKPTPPLEPRKATPESRSAPAPERKPEAQKLAEAPVSAPAAKPPPQPARPEAPRTEQKTAPTSDFAAVAKAVQDLKRQGSGDDRPAKSAPTSSAKTAAASDSDATFTAQVAEALRSAAPASNRSSLPVSSSEIDAVRRQIERCWNLPETARDVGDLIVSIRVEMNVDGTPRAAVVQNAGQMQANPHFQAAADSARRAVLNPRCHPFRLPPEKFEHWQTMTLIFNPKDIS